MNVYVYVSLCVQLLITKVPHDTNRMSFKFIAITSCLCTSSNYGAKRFNHSSSQIRAIDLLENYRSRLAKHLQVRMQNINEILMQSYSSKPLVTFAIIT